MTTVLEPTALADERAEAPEHLVPFDISWEFHEPLLVQLNNRRLFVTYDEGTMEVMSPSYEHDSDGWCLGQLMLVLADELSVPLKGISSTTTRRKDLRKGLEADQAFYLANASTIRVLKHIDFNKVPPPDLAVEVETSNGFGLRLGIYAALGVPEIWRFSKARLIVELLQPDGKYSWSPTSPTFPLLPLDLVPSLVEKSYGLDDVEWMREARRWVREHVLSRRE